MSRSLCTVLEDKPNGSDSNAIVQGLLAFNQAHTNGATAEYLVATVRDSEGKIVGGVVWSCLRGLATKSALERSRFLDASSARELGERAAAEGEERLSELASRLNLQGWRALLKGMALCHVVSNDGSFYVQPTKHVKLDAWEGISGENVLVLSSASAEEFGRSIREALGR